MVETSITNMQLHSSGTLLGQSRKGNWLFPPPARKLEAPFDPFWIQHFSDC